ncbi:MAG: methyltransferase domain-containing protein [Methanoregula sp.]|nr:methyltransferase domain-containing protein [Methanoregula sp.]
MTPHNPPTTFTWNAADYNKSSPAQQLWAQELIEKLGLSHNSRVLDIGCGDGKVTAEIASRIPKGRVLGVDNSPEMIRFANEHFPPDKYQNLSFMQADAKALPFSDEFDVVFSNAALHWILDHRPVLAGIARSLRPEGRILIQMGGKGNADQAFVALDSLLKRPAWGQYFSGFSFIFGFFDTTEYRGWLIASGFEPCRVELIPKDMMYATRKDFAAWIRTTWLPWLARLPEHAKPGFIEALIDEYLQKFPADDSGTIHIRMVRLEAEAKKMP